MYELVDIGFLKPLEQVFPTHFTNIETDILKTGIVKSPIIADKKTGIILDGSNRFAFFLKHGYFKVPVRFVNYEDENIRVGSLLVHRHLIEGKTNISKLEVLERGSLGNLFPPRTTRHFFPFRKTELINLDLNSLPKGDKRSIDYLLGKFTLDFEIKHNENFINEIHQEIDEIIRYLEEIRQTKKYLQWQIKKMREE